MIRSRKAYVPPLQKDRSARSGGVVGDLGELSAADEVELKAASYYEAGYHCGESVVKAVNEALGEPVGADVVRMASGSARASAVPGACAARSPAA
jgi:hypothetical protein